MFLISCKQKEVELPLERKKLVELMTDIYVAESMAAHAESEVRDSMHAEYLKIVAENHQLSASDIRDILKALSEMPDSLYTIQSAAADSLSVRQSREQKIDRLRNN